MEVDDLGLEGEIKFAQFRRRRVAFDLECFMVSVPLRQVLLRLDLVVPLPQLRQHAAQPGVKTASSLAAQALLL